MSDSFFRDMFEHLRTLSGRRIEWPQLLRFVIENELAKIREEGQPYAGDVFRDRDQQAYKHEFHKGQHLEVVSAQRLYREVHRLGNGCLQLGDNDVLLISYNVPNQGRHASDRLPTTTARVWAREIATFSRFLLKRNSMPRGDASPELAHIE